MGLTNLTELTEKAFENVYTLDIEKLYSVLSEAIVMADNNQDKINVAKSKFKNGLEIAKKVYNKAVNTAG